MILLDVALGTLREYYKVYRPKEYLFEGADGRKYLVIPVQKRLKSTLVLVNRYLERFPVHWISNPAVKSEINSMRLLC